MTPMSADTNSSVEQMGKGERSEVIYPHAIAAAMTTAERRVIREMVAGKWYMARELRTSGALMNQLWDWRRPIRGSRPPIDLVCRDRMEPEGIIIWEMTGLGGQVKVWVDRMQETVTIGRRSYKRLIPYPNTVDDGTSRCIRCGQIDEPEWHDHEMCVAALTPAA